MMPKIMELTEEMEDLLSKLVSKDNDEDRKKETVRQILSVADRMRAHKNANRIMRADLYVHVDDDEEWKEFLEGRTSWIKDTGASKPSDKS